MITIERIPRAATEIAVDDGTENYVFVGSSFADTLSGGLGADTLTGGTGADMFSLGDLTVADVITDYTPSEDTIDLSILVRLGAAEEVVDRGDYAVATGELEVDGITVAQINAPGGGLPSGVEIIFEDAAGQQQSAVIRRNLLITISRGRCLLEKRSSRYRECSVMILPLVFRKKLIWVIARGR